MGEKRSLSPTTVAGEAASSTSHVAKRARAEDLASASPEIKSDEQFSVPDLKQIVAARFAESEHWFAESEQQPNQSNHKNEVAQGQLFLRGEPVGLSCVRKKVSFEGLSRALQAQQLSRSPKILCMNFRFQFFVLHL